MDNITFIGMPGSGKSALIRGMFPGLELTNDDDGVMRVVKERFGV